jgi:hypothetical protein
MILLTNEQRQRLKDASSHISGDMREHLTEAQIEKTANKIDEVLFELHQENPMAFTTLAHKNEKGKVMFTALYSW